MTLNTKWLNEGRPPEENAYTQTPDEPEEYYELRELKRVKAVLADESPHISPKTRKKIAKMLDQQITNVWAKVMTYHAEP